MNPAESEESSDDEVKWLQEIKILKTRVKSEIESVDYDEDLSGGEEATDNINFLSRISSVLDRAHPSHSNVILLNEIMVAILKEMENAVLNRLDQNRADQELHCQQIKELSNQKTVVVSIPTASFVKCGIPYFKNSEGTSYSPPYSKMPVDWKRNLPRLHNGTTSCWTEKENRKLVKLVKNFWRDKALEKKETLLRVEKKKFHDESYYEKLLNEMEHISDEIDPESIDWWVVSTALGQNYSAAMCKAQWMHNCNPRLNRGPWKEEENSIFRKVAQAHNFRDWDQIAAELGTRSALQCFIKFSRTSLQMQKKKRPSSEDDKNLWELYQWCQEESPRPMIRLAYFYDEIPHLNLALRIKALSNKRQYRKTPVDDDIFLPEEDKKGTRKKRAPFKQYSTEEDFLLLEEIDRLGLDWTSIAESFPGRDIMSLQKRYSRLIGYAEGVRDLISKEEPGSQLLPSNPKNLWSVLNLTWNQVESGRRKNAGVKISKDTISLAMSQLCKHLENGYCNLFGPRFPVPRDKCAREKMACSFAVALQCLHVPSNVQTIVMNFENLSLDDPLQTLKDIETISPPNEIRNWGNCLVPPNLLTLVGIRTLGSSKGLLYAQSTLPIQHAATSYRDYIAPINRLNAFRAQDLLRKRVFSLFFLSYCMTKIPRCTVEKKVETREKCTPRGPMRRVSAKKPRSKLMKKFWRKKKKEMIDAMVNAAFRK